MEGRELHSAYALDRALVHEQTRLVAVRFGARGDPRTARLDALLARTRRRLRRLMRAYAVDTREVADFDALYELTEPCLVLFFRGRRVLCDTGTGDNNKLTRPPAPRAFETLVERVYRGAVRGRGLVACD